ncbi:MAG: radical SAM protein [Syntrophobacteraceae bacterium]|nr:radical SAM protein [Syntrophobacteraceae bacterium]
MNLSVGLGLTNDCDLKCAHCYRPRGKIYNLTLRDVKRICESLEVGSVGLGTGENGLNPEYFSIIDYLRERRIPVTLASNGLTVQTTPDQILKTFREVEFSVDFPTENEQDAFRGEGNWRRILSGIQRCRKLGMEVSVLAVLMNLNYDKLGELAKFVGALGCNLRVNVFQPAHSRAYMPSYDQYWEAFRILFDRSALISCTEPLVNTFSGLNTLHGSPCGCKSIRITPLKEVLPCVYWPGEKVSLSELIVLKEAIFDLPQFRESRRTPKGCGTCGYVANCRGGCRSRAFLVGDPDGADTFCPLTRGRMERLSFTPAGEKELLRSQSICTTIVRG